MNAFALHDATDHAGVRRWSASGIAILAAHAALIALFMNWYTPRPPPGATLPAIMVDMSPVSAAPQSTELERAPDQLMEQADASPPEPVKRQEVVEEQIAPTPPQEKPEVVAPPEQKVEMKPAAEPAKPVPTATPTPVKPKVVRPDAKKPNQATPAPRTAAPPRVERQAQAASAASAGASASALASYNQRVRAHLMRFHQYPSAANGQRGVARLSFTVSRSGQVSGGRLSGSSGVAALDAQASAMIRQASPFPPIPSEIPQGSISFTIPVAFTVR
ncbi:energy transducer TonB [Bradyrhizobium sp. AUGA SZCCT0169]|uniref:energy transducer TonB family protein n=1 Tax=Bradyrhizobium sp. AUGA SZCCT0169 TaxID=2807663 RepID=UPI001BA6F275|nr:TonB family protein [Bradyrhizobium sp. AUGA SZCCT0169]MBR1248139.1 energy transducer TonB [Bradyrhizobium sp. AUGA SZCCT0169]